MKNIFVKLAIAIAIISISYSCKKEKSGILQAKVVFYFGDSLLKPDAHYNFTAMAKNYQFRMDVMKLYLSNITITNSTKQSVKLKDVVLANYLLNDKGIIIDSIPAGDYSNLTFNLGLDSILNNSKPGSFAFDNPLSTAQSMYWGMVKYRFAVLEGIVYDNMGTELNAISFHTGVDLVREKVFSQNIKIMEDKTTMLTIKIDISKVFTDPINTISPTSEIYTHTNPGKEYNISTKVMDNLVTGTTLNIQ